MARRAVRTAPHETPYQRRIRIYKERHPGATTQEARGKKAGEHVERKAREQAKTGLSPYQRGKIKADAKEQSRRSGHDASRIEAGFTALVRNRGWDAYKRLRAFINEKHRESLHQGKVVTLRGAAMNRAEMEDLADEYEIDLEWLYYR